MRKIVVISLIFIVLCCCVSCSENEEQTPENAISVYYSSDNTTYIVPGDDPSEEQIPENAISVYYPSDDITYIVPGDYPSYNAEDGEASKWGYNVFVSKMNADNKLVLSGNRNEGLERTSKTYSGIYYQSGDWFGYEDGVFLNSEKVISEACVGMVASWMEGSALLIITNTDENSYVYSAKLVDGSWELNTEDRIELGSTTKFIYYDWPLFPIMTCSPTETMYIITENNLITLSVRDYLDGDGGDFTTVNKTQIETPEYWHYLRPTSAVKLDEKVYFGDMFGVVEYDVNTHAFTYYQVDLKSMKR